MREKVICKQLKTLVENIAVQYGLNFECYSYEVEIIDSYLCVTYHEQPSKKVRK